MRKGITLIELLVVIAITSILAGGIFFAYRNIVQQAITQSLVAKNEQDVEVLLHSLRKDIASIGFGVPASSLRFWASPSCNNLNAFASSNSTIGRVSCADNDELYFLSLSVRQFGDSGCWWIVDSTRNIRTLSSKWTLENCPNTPPGQRICLDMSNKNSVDCTETIPINTLVFPTDGQPLANFSVRYYLDNTNIPGECAPGTFNLNRWINGDVPQPVASCIATFRVRYFDGSNYSENPPADLRSLVALRICMLVQVGGRTGVLIDPPNTFERCGSISVNPQWREYRWKIIEEDIPLHNIR
ncbi:type II secretion system protein [Thermocrinis sp.]